MANVYSAQQTHPRHTHCVLVFIEARSWPLRRTTRNQCWTYLHGGVTSPARRSDPLHGEVTPRFPLKRECCCTLPWGTIRRAPKAFPLPTPEPTWWAGPALMSWRWTHPEGRVFSLGERARADLFTLVIFLRADTKRSTRASLLKPEGLFFFFRGRYILVENHRPLFLFLMHRLTLASPLNYLSVAAARSLTDSLSFFMRTISLKVEWIWTESPRPRDPRRRATRPPPFICRREVRAARGRS